MHQTVHSDNGPGPMDRPRQGDSLAGNMAEQIIGIACGSVGTPLKGHERRGRTQQQPSASYNITVLYTLINKNFDYFSYTCEYIV